MRASRPDRSERGFSLMEVATAIGVIAFALVALVGMFPVGLDNSRRCVSETRSAQLLKMVVSTLQSEPFEAAECFATSHADSGKPDKLDLRNLPLGTPAANANQAIAFPTTPDALLYVSYDVREVPQIVRLPATAPKPDEAIYRLELRFAKQVAPSATGATSRLAGSIVDIRLCNAVGKDECFAETQALIPNFSRIGYAP